MVGAVAAAAPLPPFTEVGAAQLEATVGARKQKWQHTNSRQHFANWIKVFWAVILTSCQVGQSVVGGGCSEGGGGCAVPCHRAVRHFQILSDSLETLTSGPSDQSGLLQEPHITSTWLAFPTLAPPPDTCPLGKQTRRLNQ